MQNLQTFDWLVLLLLPFIGFAVGYFIRMRKGKKEIGKIMHRIGIVKKEQFELRRDYEILLQAMEGAKAHAEELQRKLYGTNIIEITEHEDPELILNRQQLAKYINDRLPDDPAQSDNINGDEPGGSKVLKSVMAMDDQVVNILTEAILKRK